MAVKTYNYQDKTQLSAHFNVQEFRCKCGQKHDILIAEELVTKLETLFTKLNCSKIIVTSGYRCTTHDKAVGGSGTGQHVNGNAADICCYSQDDRPISSKLVCCAAQDIGFGGIANITKEYIHTHVDVRSGSKWYGNEIVNYSTVTDDFYKYFGISKSSGGSAAADNLKERDAMKGIDVSRHNGSIDWNKVKADGVQFAILRAGYGKLTSQKDAWFEAYYSGAKSAGIPVGAYWYSYATTVEEARQEAEVCISILKGKQFEFPIFFDLEEKAAFNTGKANCSAMIRAFCNALEAAGYWAGLYMSRSPFNDYTENDIRTRYALWLAEYNAKLNYSGTVGMWQKSDSGRVNGISGNVDMDEGYINYPEQIKAAGLNGFRKEVAETAAPADQLEQSEQTDDLTGKLSINGKNYTVILKEDGNA